MYSYFKSNQSNEFYKTQCAQPAQPDVLTQYECLFDIRGQRLLLRESTMPPVFDLNAQFTLGFQVGYDEAGLVVIHAWEGLPSDYPAVGDRIELDGVALDAAEAVNDVVSKLTFLQSDNPIEIRVNGEPRVLQPIPFFT